MLKKLFFTSLALVLATVFSLSTNSTQAQPDLSQKLSGHILLQVEENGEAWYVNPDNHQRHFMGRPKDAFQLMRDLGTGITTDKLNQIPVGGLDDLTGPDSDGDGLPNKLEQALNTNPNQKDTDGDSYNDKQELKGNYDPNGSGELNINDTLAQNQAGKILLQVENNGEAWYINPDDHKRYFLGRPADAFQVMRKLGQGVSNQNLAKINNNNKTETKDIPTNIGEKLKSKEKEVITSGGTTLIKENFGHGVVGDFLEINGRLTYIGTKGRGKYFVVHGDKRRKQYNNIEEITEINNKLTYIAKERKGPLKGSKKFVVQNGKEMSRYNDIHSLKEINNKITYIAREGNKGFVVHGEQKTKKYDRVYHVLEVNNELVYVASNNGEHYVIREGKVIGTHDNVSYPTEINNKLAYIARRESGSKFYDRVIYGEEKRKEYREISSSLDPSPIREFKDKLLYTAYDGNKNYLIHGRKEIKENKVKDFGEVKVINNKLAYKLHTPIGHNNPHSFVVYNGEKQKTYNGGVMSLTEVNDRLTYRAFQNGKAFIVRGGEEHTRYSNIWAPVEVDDKLAYRARQKGLNGKEFVVYNGREQEKYDSASSVSEFNDKLVYAAKKGDQWYIIREK